MNLEKFDGINWRLFRKKFIAHSIKADEVNKTNCLDIIQYAEIIYHQKGKAPPVDSQDAVYLAQFTKLKDHKKKSAQNLVYSALAMSCLDACPGIVCAVDERRETCGSDLWMVFLSAYEPRPRSTFSFLCSMIYQSIAFILWLIMFVLQSTYFFISLLLGFLLFAVEIVLDVVRAIVESFHILGIPRLRQSTVPR